MPNYRAMVRSPLDRARSYDEWNDVGGHDHASTIIVHETEQEPVRTGLVDATGTPIYRFPERRQIGFRLREK